MPVLVSRGMIRFPVESIIPACVWLPSSLTLPNHVWGQAAYVHYARGRRFNVALNRHVSPCGINDQIYVICFGGELVRLICGYGIYMNPWFGIRYVPRSLSSCMLGKCRCRSYYRQYHGRCRYVRTGVSSVVAERIPVMWYNPSPISRYVKFGVGRG